MAEKAEAVFFKPANPVRAGFLNVLTARQFKGKGDPRYDGSFIFEPESEDLKNLKDLCITALKAANPGKKVVPRRLTQEELDSGSAVEVQIPWKDGTKLADKAKAEKKDQEFFRGKVVVKGSSKFEPGLGAILNGKIVSFDDEAARKGAIQYFYSGAYFIPNFELHTYNSSGDPSEGNYKPGGIGLWLPNILFVKKGERIGGGRANAAEVFKSYVGKTTTEDPGSNEPAEDSEF